ncbi:hypothetical protein NQT66_18480 [Cellulophaga baltica]|uniref:hypothetical protein n=1 Tax=Cellulophaga baltica TaxID=76594 RepID=UPI002147A6E4|nr:hypothetical protein [Cellulophaga baltica]MCR1026812.1 hypothetical protein [Cellulophaga baltica]
MEIKLTLAAEDFSNCYGIMVLENGAYEIEIDQSKIPTDFMERLKAWYTEYYPYTGMTMKKLESKIEKITALDNIGIELLKELYNRKLFNNLGIDKYVYWSRGTDKIMCQLY